MNRVTRILRPSLFTLSLLLLAAAPVHAGVIQIDFTASVTDEGGPLGTAGDAFVGLIRIELVDFPDREGSADDATFADGPLFGTDLGLTATITFDLFADGGTPSFDLENSIVLDIDNSPNGDRLNVFVRSVGSSGDIFDELSFEIDGTSDLFAGDLGLDENLPGLEALLLSFDFDQAIPGAFTSRVISNIGPGLPNASNIGRPGANEETVLIINSASITLQSGSITDVPEPGSSVCLRSLCCWFEAERYSAGQRSTSGESADQSALCPSPSLEFGGVKVCLRSKRLFSGALTRSLSASSIAAF